MTTNFFHSKENLVGASEAEPYFCIDNALVVTGVGPSENAACITDLNGQIILHANNENLLWHGGCIHRFPSALGYGPQSIERALKLQHQATARLKQEPEIITIKKKSIFLGHAFGWHAYGHLHDTLQRLFFPQVEEGSEDWTLVVSKHDRIISFTEHLSALVGRPVSEPEIITLDNNICYHFDQLVYSHSPATLTTYTPESLAWINKAYRTYFRAENVNSIPGIYLSRNHVRPGTRGVINEAEVVNYLQDNNFIIVNGSESLAEIVNLFSNANKVIGAHGSLFANTFLCSREADILELCPHNRIDVTFRNKLKLTSSYRQVVVDADEDHNLTIDMNILRQFIEGELNAPTSRGSPTK